MSKNRATHDLPRQAGPGAFPGRVTVAQVVSGRRKAAASSLPARIPRGAFPACSSSGRSWRQQSRGTAWATAGNWDALPANDLITDIANFNLAAYGGDPVYASNTDSPVGGNDSVMYTTISGNIGELGSSMSLTKTGNSTLTLSGINTFTGATNVSAGKLAMGNASALQCSAYDTTGSNGTTIGINLTLGGATTLSSGNTASMAAGTMSLAGTGMVNGTLNGPGTLEVADGGKLKGTGTIGGTVNVCPPACPTIPALL